MTPEQEGAKLLLRVTDMAWFVARAMAVLLAYATAAAAALAWMCAPMLIDQFAVHRDPSGWLLIGGMGWFFFWGAVFFLAIVFWAKQLPDDFKP